MTRAAAAALLPVILCACTGAVSPAAVRPSNLHDLALVQASYAPARYSHMGAPIDALTVSGTIANRGRSALACAGSSFIITDMRGNSYTPVSASCQAPSILPKQAATFSALFRTPLRRNLELHFEHDDGTYEVRALHLRP